MRTILTTICFLAISFSFANNKEIKKDEQIKDLPCSRMYSQEMDMLMNYYCATFEDANAIASRNFDECLEIFYGD